MIQSVVDQAEEQPAKIGQAVDNVTPISKPAKLSKAQIKRNDIFMERLRRKMNEGKSQQEALAAIAKEDYDRMPADQKIQRLESMIKGMAQQMSSDMMNLRRNDGAIADAFDINYRAISKMFRKLGLSIEDEKTLSVEAQNEWNAERQAKLDAQAKKAAEEMMKAKEADEKAVMEAEAEKMKSVVGTPEAAEEEPHIAEGATVYHS